MTSGVRPHRSDARLRDFPIVLRESVVINPEQRRALLPTLMRYQVPRWPEHLLGSIDRAKAARGGALYAQHCQNCHLPPPDSAA